MPMKRVAVPGLVLARAASLVEEGRPKLPWECTESNADFAQFQECANYLGPNGFDAVQVSPVTEHILGSDTCRTQRTLTLNPKPETLNPKP